MLMWHFSVSTNQMVLIVIVIN